MNDRSARDSPSWRRMDVELDRKAEARKREVADRGGANARLGVSVLDPGLLPRRGAQLAVHEVRTATVGCLRGRSLDTRSGIGTQALQEKGAECPFLPSCDRSCPNARTRARIARAIVTVGLGVMVIPVRQATSVPLGGT
jgi:hypothetical protein